jgi:hypothetical protein
MRSYYLLESFRKAHGTYGVIEESIDLLRILTFFLLFFLLYFLNLNIEGFEYSLGTFTSNALNMLVFV